MRGVCGHCRTAHRKLHSVQQLCARQQRGSGDPCRNREVEAGGEQRQGGSRQENHSRRAADLYRRRSFGFPRRRVRRHDGFECGGELQYHYRRLAGHAQHSEECGDGGARNQGLHPRTFGVGRSGSGQHRQRRGRGVGGYRRRHHRRGHFRQRRAAAYGGDSLGGQPYHLRHPTRLHHYATAGRSAQDTFRFGASQRGKRGEDRHHSRHKRQERARNLAQTIGYDYQRPCGRNLRTGEL